MRHERPAVEPRRKCGCLSGIPCPSASSPPTATLRPPEPPCPRSPSRWPWRRVTDRHGHLRASSQGNLRATMAPHPRLQSSRGGKGRYCEPERTPRNRGRKTLQQEAALKFRDSIEFLHIAPTTEPANRALPRRPHAGEYAEHVYKNNVATATATEQFPASGQQWRGEGRENKAK